MARLLIAGFGDVARRALPALASRHAVTALLRHADGREAVLREAGARVLLADLDDPGSLAGCAGFELVAHLAPPPGEGAQDTRSRHLLAALDAAPPERLVYVSTSGVYGDCKGALVDETRPVNPDSDRARRRVDAERLWLDWGARRDVRIVVLRAPGIYAADRLSLERIRRGTPALREEDDVYTNHIHADDLAMMLVTALEHPDAQGVYNASDDSALRMGEWFDLLADRHGLPRPPRIPLAEAAARIPAPLLSFMRESRRLDNSRIKRELGVSLAYPTVREGVPDRRAEHVSDRTPDPASP